MHTYSRHHIHINRTYGYSVLCVYLYTQIGDLFILIFHFKYMQLSNQLWLASQQNAGRGRHWHSHTVSLFFSSNEKPFRACVLYLFFRLKFFRVANKIQIHLFRRRKNSKAKLSSRQVNWTQLIYTFLVTPFRFVSWFVSIHSEALPQFRLQRKRKKKTSKST